MRSPLLPALSLLSALVLIAVVATPCAAQYRWNIWMLTNDRGIRFDTAGAPHLIQTTHMQYDWIEGTSAVCNPSTGEPLFYTDGHLAWNAPLDSLSPGSTAPIEGADSVGALNSYTLSTIIVPMPGASNVYYVFSVGQTYALVEPDTGMYYSVIDMNANGGRGQCTARRRLLDRTVSGGVAAVRAERDSTYWVIAHAESGDWFKVWKVGPEGLSGPTVIHAGGYTGSAVSTIKLSPDGRLLARCVPAEIDHEPFDTMGVLQLFSFDPATGAIGHLASYYTIDTSRYSHGTSSLDSITVPGEVEFSPDGKYIYAVHGIGSIYHDEQLSALSQVSISSLIDGTWRDALTVLDTMTRERYDSATSTTFISGFGALKLGPDGRIYVSGGRDLNGESSLYLGVIPSPNTPGKAAGYLQKGLYIGEAYEYMQSWGGLPNTIANDVPGSDGWPPSPEPAPFTLLGAIPNPLVDQGAVGFTINRPGTVRIDLYDMLGRERGNVVDDFFVNTGLHRERFDASGFESGVYVLRMHYEGRMSDVFFTVLR